jgi:DNA processing protein
LTPSTPDGELKSALALLHTPRVGPRTYRGLIERFGSPENVYAAPDHALSGLGLSKDTLEGLKRPDWNRIENDLRWLEVETHHCLAIQHPAYPALLKEIADPPPLLFVSGSLDALSYSQIAVVGSRNPSPDGSQLARGFARALVDNGLAVTSGLALGVDAAAHGGALDGGGITLAVMGTGLDQIYPRSHVKLAAAILAAGGALISELPTQTPPQASNFPRRNRIISGLSLGVLVVAAALKSGSLITARLAAEQGREVFALPGSIHNPLARGCNSLIKQGAKLVETVDDILDEFDMSRQTRSNPPTLAEPADELGPESLALLKYIAYAPTSVDTLVAATGNTPEAITSLLLLLELQGHIVSADGGYSRIR